MAPAANATARALRLLPQGKTNVFWLRLEAPTEPRACDLEVLAGGRPAAGADVRVLGSYAPGAFAVSLRLPAGTLAFDLCWQGRKVFSLSKIDTRRLRIKSDLAMVNPGIDAQYHGWLAQQEPLANDADGLPLQPLMSVVVPLFNTPERYLTEMLDSVVAQTYRKWELVLVNASPKNEGMAEVLARYTDPRIRIVAVEKNLGIAGNTNVGVAATTGDYVCFFDHDDVIEPQLLAEYVRHINRQPDCDLIYCDEDNFEESLDASYEPRLKPDFNLDLLYSHNYVVHMLTVSRRILDLIDLSPDYTSGAQDYDLTLKAAEHARAIVRVPRVLYHWRCHPGSTNGGVMDSKPYAIEAGRRALADHFARRGLAATVEPSYINCVYDVRFEPAADARVTAVVPFESHADVAAAAGRLAADPLVDRVICVGLGAKAALAGADDTVGEKTVALAWDAPYDYAAMVNAALELVETPLVAVVRETVALDADALGLLAGNLERPEVGVAAPKLLFADKTVQHAGLCVKRDGSLDYLNQGFGERMGGGYFGFAECCCDYSAVGPDCLVARTDTLREAGGMPTGYENPVAAVAHLCLALRDKGLLALTAANACGVNRVAPLEGNALEGASADARRLWAAFGGVRQDVLANPSVQFESSYPQLDMPRDEGTEWRNRIRRFIARKVFGR